MPPAKTPAKAAARNAARAAAAKPQPAPRSRLSRAFGRFGAAQKTPAKARSGNLSTLLRETRQELRKVEWPSREEATKLTAAVVGLSGGVGDHLDEVDFIFQEFFKFLIERLSSGGV